MQRPGTSRRRFLRTAVAATLSAPFVRTSHAAGKLSIGVWDHWAPGANAALKRTIDEWADQHKVDAQVDFITTQGNKLTLTTAAQFLAKAGHDIFTFVAWQPSSEYGTALEPVNDVVDALVKQNGPVNGAVEYLCRLDGRWTAVPATFGSQIKSPCSRIDLIKQHAGIDVQAMYPAGLPPKAESWDLNTFLKAAEACHRAGFPFGIGLGATSDSVDTAGAIFQSFGAVLVDAKRNIVVRSDAVRQALEYYKKLAEFLPPDVPGWDDAANNKWLIAGKGALIMNPPSAWAVAKIHAPSIAEQLWTHGMPAGPHGRFAPFLPFFWGIWSFSKNKTAAKELLMHLSQPASIEDMVAASGGYDLPPFPKFSTLRTWREAGPPKGTLYHYPNPHDHQTLAIAAQPAPAPVARQIYLHAIQTKMVVRYIQGEALENTLVWAEGELDGFVSR